jgi:hypothetical protein
MTTPFEYFRTPIQIYRFNNGYYLNGIWQEGSGVVIGSDLVSGNVINITLNGIALSPITYTTSSLNTLTLIQQALAAQPNIDSVLLSGADNLTITIVPIPPNFAVVNSFIITGGASQPTVTINVSPQIINATASMQPLKGNEVELVPEGRRDRETYNMYSSTQVFDLTTQNPDQVTVLKGPFTGFIFEVLDVMEWQNNANFNIVNHYEYLAMRLKPLP